MNAFCGRAGLHRKDMIMPQEATLYSPVIDTDGYNVRVIFAKGHPGFHDLDYQEHRGRIARLVLQYVPGQPIPDADYTEDKHEL
jgi:phenylalanine-4-hydroxylase